MRRLAKRSHNNHGQASVELILGMVFLLTVIFSVMQLIVYMYTYVMLAQGAKEGVRYAIVHGSSNTLLPSGPGNTTNVENQVKIYINRPGMTVTVTYVDGNNDPPSRVRVVATSPFSMLSGFTVPSVKAAAEGRIFY